MGRRGRGGGQARKLKGRGQVRKGRWAGEEGEVGRGGRGGGQKSGHQSGIQKNDSSNIKTLCKYYKHLNLKSLPIEAI